MGWFLRSRWSIGCCSSCSGAQVVSVSRSYRLSIRLTLVKYLVAVIVEDNKVVASAASAASAASVLVRAHFDSVVYRVVYKIYETLKRLKVLKLKYNVVRDEYL